MERKVTYPGLALPYALLAPQILIIIVFFYLPAGQALWMSMELQDPLGLSVQFVGLENFATVLAIPPIGRRSRGPSSSRSWLRSARWCPPYCSPSWPTRSCAARRPTRPSDHPLRHRARRRRRALALPVQPSVASSATISAAGRGLESAHPERRRHGADHHRSAWKQIAYNFIFFLAGLQSIPKSLIEAAKIDGASESRRFWTIIFPLLSPTTFFLIVVNFVYAFFETFGVVHAATQGGRARRPRS